MWRLLTIALFVTGAYFHSASTTAFAQKAAGVEGSRWNGFYTGVYAGQAWAESGLHTDPGIALPNRYFNTATDIDSITRLGSGSISPDAFVGGVQVGAGLQMGNFVFGLEADFGAFHLNGAKGGDYVIPNPIDPSNPALGTVGVTIGTDWLLTARGRIGWTPSSNLLLYATGGLAVTELRLSNSYSDNAPSVGVGGSGANKMMIGWALGGGAEWALSRHWSLKAEYMHIDFGSVMTQASVFCGPASQFDCASFGAVASPLSTKVDLSADFARVGVNYKFD